MERELGRDWQVWAPRAWIPCPASGNVRPSVCCAVVRRGGHRPRRPRTPRSTPGPPRRRRAGRARGCARPESAGQGPPRTARARRGASTSRERPRSRAHTRRQAWTSAGYVEATSSASSPPREAPTTTTCSTPGRALRAPERPGEVLERDHPQLVGDTRRAEVPRAPGRSSRGMRGAGPAGRFRSLPRCHRGRARPSTRGRRADLSSSGRPGRRASRSARSTRPPLATIRLTALASPSTRAPARAFKRSVTASSSGNSPSFDESATPVGRSEARSAPPWTEIRPSSSACTVRLPDHNTPSAERDDRVRWIGASRSAPSTSIRSGASSNPSLGSSRTDAVPEPPRDTKATTAAAAIARTTAVPARMPRRRQSVLMGRHSVAHPPSARDQPSGASVRNASRAAHRGSTASSACSWGSTFRSFPQIGQRPAQSGRHRIWSGSPSATWSARPRTDVELAVGDVFAAQLLVRGGVGRLVLLGLDVDREARRSEAPHARPVEPRGETQAVEIAGRRSLDDQLRRRLGRRRVVRLATEDERVEHEPKRFVMLLTGAQAQASDGESGHGTRVPPAVPPLSDDRFVRRVKLP